MLDGWRVHYPHWDHPSLGGGFLVAAVWTTQGLQMILADHRGFQPGEEGP